MQVMIAAALISALLPCWAAAQEAPAALPALRASSAEVLPEEKGPRRVIRFLTSADYPPFQLLAADQNPAGFNVDLARAICDELAFPCTIQALPWDELLGALEGGRADALMAGLRPNEDLLGKAELTRPYFRVPARFAMRRGSVVETVTPAALAGKKVAVVSGSAHEAYLKAFFADSEIQPHPDTEAARAAVKQGAADAVFADGVGLSLWLGGTQSAECCAFAGGAFLESRYFGEGMVIAVRKGDTRLRQDLDRTLDAVEEKGILGDLYLRWFPIGIF